MSRFDPYGSLVPVLLETESPQRLQQMGTAIFIEQNSAPFLITAAHVTDNLRHAIFVISSEKLMGGVTFDQNSSRPSDPCTQRGLAHELP